MDVINLMYGPFIFFHIMIVGTLMFYFLSLDSIFSKTHTIEISLFFFLFLGDVWINFHAVDI